MRLAASAALSALLALAPATVPAATLPFRGLLFQSTGSASALVWSPRSNVAELRCTNIGSSGEDGVSVALGDDCDAWSFDFGPVPDGASPPDAFTLALFETAGPGGAPFATTTHSLAGGRVRCVTDSPDALEWFVEVWDGETLVHSALTPSPPVVDLPAGVGMCEVMVSAAVAGALSLSSPAALARPSSASGLGVKMGRIELTTRVRAPGVITVNGANTFGDRVRTGMQGGSGRALSRATLVGTHGGGGGGAGGFSVRAHGTRFGAGASEPTSPLGITVNDGNDLVAPDSPEYDGAVQLGAGMTAWRVGYEDLTRPGEPYDYWGLDVAPVSGPELAAGAELEFHVPSLWTSGPDTTRILVRDPGDGTGPSFVVTNADSGKGDEAGAYSGDFVLTLSGSAPQPAPFGARRAAAAATGIASSPSGFRARVEAGALVIRCPMPPGTTVFSGGLAWPCDSFEVRIRGAGDDACEGILAPVLAGRGIDKKDIRRGTAYLHHSHPGRAGGVSVTPVGDATLQRLGGAIRIHGISATGGDGALLSGAGGGIRVKLAGTFSNGDVPQQQRFTAVEPVIDGAAKDAAWLQVEYGPDALGTPAARVKAHSVHNGSKPMYLRLSDGSVHQPGDCDDDGDGFMDFRQAPGGASAMLASVAYRRDSPWTEVFDVAFAGPMTVTARGTERTVSGFRLWRNRGGEAEGTPAPPVLGLLVQGLPPAVPALGPQGVSGLEIERIEVQSAGSGLEAGGAGHTIGGHPVIPTWVRVFGDSSNHDPDSDGDSVPDSDGITLIVRGLINPIAMDKGLRVDGEPEARGFAFTGDFAAAHAQSESVTVDLAVSGSVLGAHTPRLYGLTQGRKYNYHECWPMMANTPDPLLVRCFAGGAVVSEFPLTDSIRTTLAPSSVVVDDCDDDGRGDFQFELPPLARVVAPGGVELDCDRIEVHASGAQEPWELDGACRVTLNGLPPGVPVTGLRLATVPAADPALGVTPGGAGRAFALSRPWPNPARGALRASFALPAASRVRARVLDVAGRLVATLADARYAAGEHVLAWDGRTASGAPAPAGVYFLRVDRDGREALNARFTRLR